MVRIGESGFSYDGQDGWILVYLGWSALVNPDLLRNGWILIYFGWPGEDGWILIYLGWLGLVTKGGQDGLILIFL